MIHKAKCLIKAARWQMLDKVIKLSGIKREALNGSQRQDHEAGCPVWKTTTLTIRSSPCRHMHVG